MVIFPALNNIESVFYKNCSSVKPLSILKNIHKIHMNNVIFIHIYGMNILD